MNSLIISKLSPIARGLIFWLMASPAALVAQSPRTLSIGECQSLAASNYPLIHQVSLIEQSREYNLDNASKGNLPQVVISGQATYQSEVTGLPIDIPNLNIGSLSKDQYKLTAEISQSLTDGFTIKHQKELVDVNADADRNKLEVELYNIKSRVNQLFFGILLIDAQLKQIDLLKKDIQSGIDRTNAAIENGVALKSSLSQLQAEMLNVEQRITELEATREGYAAMLSQFIGETVDQSTLFVVPQPVNTPAEIHRPELKIYDAQFSGIEIQDKLIGARKIPRVNLFVQGGYGRPGLNFLSNSFEPFALGGLRLNWNLAAFYTAKKEREVLRVSKSIVDIQRETFVFNTHLALSQQQREMQKFQELIERDKEIVALRESIVTTAKAQLEGGTITTFDFLNTVNAGDQARQNLTQHEVQWLLAQYNYQTSSGY